MAKTNPAEFVRQIRNEMSKVTWPTRKEATVTTVMVCIMAAIMSIFFLFVDKGLAFIIEQILKIGS